MPNKATVRGVLMDATLAPIAAGKIVATLQGSDIFDGGLRVVTQKVEATTDAQGGWSLDLIVNGEGERAGTTWTIEGYNHYVAKVFEAKSLFLASALATTLGELERTSAQNLRAAREGNVARLITVSDHDRYLALPESQRRPNDLLVLDGRDAPPVIHGTIEGSLFQGVQQIYLGGEPAALLDASGAVLIGAQPPEPAVAPTITRQPALLPEGAGLGDSITLDLGAAEGAPPPAAAWDLTLGDSSIRDQVDPDQLSMELSEPGEYALAVNWSNASGTAVAAPALLTVAEPGAPGLDYARAAGYFHAGSAFSGTADAVSGLVNGGNGGWDLARVGSGQAIAMTPAGIRFDGGGFLQASGISTSGIGGMFVVLRLAIEHHNSGVAQLFATNPAGGPVSITSNKGKLQSYYHDGETSRVVNLGGAPATPEAFVVGIEIDNAAQMVRAYTRGGSIATFSVPGIPGVEYATVAIGQRLHGTVMRAALFGRPAGGSFAASFEQVIEDFLSA
ncbi:hypothetical protein [Paracoccus versutus]|uniref:Uncharacterized protein n=2 Tax=Paracoccus TaxID=265 RepID=A0A3D9XG18_PARVE|nr:hypothetical protein [Paracoccus versutus]REF68571.1 hypothetical protein BDD41_3634 [Paracoccus versutus]